MSRSRGKGRRRRGTGPVVATTCAAEPGVIEEIPDHTDRPGRAVTTCGWCGASIAVKNRGRTPKWCSVNCRRRAWDQSRAAASGRAAVEVVMRRVEVPIRAAQPAPLLPRHGAWAPLLRELADQLDTGRVYERDLPDIEVSLDAVLQAYSRRRSARRR